MEFLYLHHLFFKKGLQTKIMIQFSIKIPIILQMAFAIISLLILYLALQIIKMNKMDQHHLMVDKIIHQISKSIF